MLNQPDERAREPAMRLGAARGHGAAATLSATDTAKHSHRNLLYLFWPLAEPLAVSTQPPVRQTTMSTFNQHQPDKRDSVVSTTTKMIHQQIRTVGKRKSHRPPTEDTTTRQALVGFSKSLITIFIISSILSHINYHSLGSFSAHFFAHAQETTSTDFCNEDYDCKDGERFCHENKCICPRERPIEDKERSLCLSLALINETCYTDAQCLSGANCLDGICACSSDHISLFNPSTKVYYCHPKRRLKEDCNHDAQCPGNAFCSTKKHGCLCQNGYGEALLVNNGVETAECLTKSCKSHEDCESEYHVCDESRCKCLATHFDPHTALCYRFASVGGQQENTSSINGNLTNSGENYHENNDIKSILKDLTMDGERMWPIIVGLILFSLLLLIFMICLVRKYCLGYCWTVHKKEYEPNNKDPTKSQFDKNSINNKSFRRKNVEQEDDDGNETDEMDNSAADRSNLMTTTAGGSNKGNKSNNTNRQQGGNGLSQSPFKSNSNGNGENNSVKVDMPNSSYSTEDSDKQYSSGAEHHYQPFHQVLSRPLASSTSTAV